MHFFTMNLYERNCQVHCKVKENSMCKRKVICLCFYSNLQMTRSEASTCPATDDLKAILFFKSCMILSRFHPCVRLTLNTKSIVSESGNNAFNLAQLRAILLPFQSRESVSIEDITAFEKFKTQCML